jgi:hypothetical protein
MSTRLRLIALGVVMLLFAAIGLAQDNKKESQLRMVHGVTMDKGESPIPSAVVFLKNTRSNAIRSYISDEQGNYRFSGLDPNIDYEVHAEKRNSRAIAAVLRKAGATHAEERQGHFCGKRRGGRFYATTGSFSASTIPAT